MRDLCNPVVGAVSGHVAADVEALQDVEGRDQGHAGVGGGGRHHMVSCSNTPEQTDMEKIVVRRDGSTSGMKSLRRRQRRRSLLKHTGGKPEAS